MARDYKLISADSHLEIDPSRWTNRIPAKYRDFAPRLVKLPDGGDGIIVENRPLYTLGLAVTGKPYEEHSPVGIRYEGSPGTGTAEQRLQEQNLDGVDAEVLFTSAGNSDFWRGIRDDGAYRAVVRAYNEFLGEEYSAVDRDRLLAMGIIPDAGVDAAVEELEYCAEVGLKGVALGTFPSGKGFPTPEDDKFWAAAIDLQMPLTVHIGFRQKEGPLVRFPRSPEGLARTANPAWLLTQRAMRAANAVQLTLAGVFDRFPGLRLYWAETNLGWFAFAMEHLDDEYLRVRHWAESVFGMQPLKRKPSEYIREHNYFGFVKDRSGIEVRHALGTNRAMWANDFPHAVGDWPHSREVVDEIFEGVPDDERYRMTCGNAIEFFHLAEANGVPA
jgi:predicted TIM-barrel fold metal-dependent hydrolase